MFKRVTILMLLTAMVVIGVVGVVSAQDGATMGPILQQIVDRGELICGVNPGLAGFAVQNDAGEYSGFDVDLCRAVAIAILGDGNAVSFRPLTAAERQAAIQGGEIDMMSRNTTWTLSRDSGGGTGGWGVTFAPTTFYDGAQIGTLAELGVSTLSELDGAEICIQQGTTTEVKISDAIAERGLEIEILIFQDGASTFAAYAEGRCTAWATDYSGVVSYHSTAADPSAHVILDEVFSKEPLGPLSPQSDPQFADIIAWTVYGLFTAEEEGVTSENVADMVNSDNLSVQRLLGQAGNDTGNLLGIKNDFMVDVISQIGNYGEMFERHLTPLGIERGYNALWSDGGLLYAPPF